MHIASKDNFDLEEHPHREGAHAYGSNVERILLNLTGARLRDLAVEPQSDIEGTASNPTCHLFFSPHAHTLRILRTHGHACTSNELLWQWLHPACVAK